MKTQALFLCLLLQFGGGSLMPTTNAQNAFVKRMDKYIVGADGPFEGITAGDEQEIFVLYTHGIGRHQPIFAKPFVQGIKRKLYNATVTVEEVYALPFAIPEMAIDGRTPEVKAYIMHYLIEYTWIDSAQVKPSEKRYIHLFALNWTELGVFAKDFLNMNDFTRKRYPINNMLRSGLFNNSFSDPVMFSGFMKKYFQQSVKETLWLMAGCGMKCNNTLRVISGSLGSYMSYSVLAQERIKDTIFHPEPLTILNSRFANRVVASDQYRAHELVGDSCLGFRVTHYMLTNQLPLFAVAGDLLPPSVPYKIIAFNDPNDILCFGMYPENDPAMPFKQRVWGGAHVTVVNATVHNQKKGGNVFPGIPLANPGKAHSGAPKNKWLQMLILYGSGPVADPPQRHRVFCSIAPSLSRFPRKFMENYAGMADIQPLAPGIPLPQSPPNAQRNFQRDAAPFIASAPFQGICENKGPVLLIHGVGLDKDNNLLLKKLGAAHPISTVEIAGTEAIINIYQANNRSIYELKWSGVTYLRKEILHWYAQYPSDKVNDSALKSLTFVHNLSDINYYLNEKQSSNDCSNLHYIMKEFIEYVMSIESHKLTFTHLNIISGSLANCMVYEALAQYEANLPPAITKLTINHYTLTNITPLWLMSKSSENRIQLFPSDPERIKYTFINFTDPNDPLGYEMNPANRIPAIAAPFYANKYFVNISILSTKHISSIDDFLLKDHSSKPLNIFSRPLLTLFPVVHPFYAGDNARTNATVLELIYNGLQPLPAGKTKVKLRDPAVKGRVGQHIYMRKVRGRMVAKPE